VAFFSHLEVADSLPKKEPRRRPMGLLSLVLLVTNVSFAVVRNRLRACEVPCLVLDRTRLSLCAGG
jgi:hypothetical protein